MKTINLKKYYYPICKKDTFVEVPDEVADAIVEESRAEDANDAKQHYHCYSLDASPGMENHFPEQAVSSLTPTQARRVHARYMLGMKVKDIAAMEGITPSQAGKSIHAALRRLRRYFIRRKWTSGL